MSVFCELTPVEAFVPYGIVVDPEQNIWLAAKGGLFKLSPDGSEILFEKKNKNRKQIAAFPKVEITQDRNGDDRVVSCFGDSRSPISNFGSYSLDGKSLSTDYYDGRITDMCTNAEGVVYATTQQNFRKSEILVSRIGELGVQDSVLASTEVAFQRICVLPHGAIAVSTASLPINPYSAQEIQILDGESGRLIRSFSSEGQEDGKIFWPRALQSTPDGSSLAVLDKTGRIQKFRLADGKYEGIIGKVAANTGNGFCFANPEKILVTCSGIVEENEGATVGDWIESLNILTPTED